MKDNQNKISGVAESSEPKSSSDRMKMFDSLPKEMRELIANAPFCYGVTEVIETIDLIGLPAAITFASDSMKRHVGIAAFHDYGPDHPQSQNCD